MNNSICAINPDNFIAQGRSRPIGNGLLWISQAWQLYKKQPALWSVFAIATFIAFLLVSSLPVISHFSSILLTILIAGFIHSADRAASGKEVLSENFFYGFNYKFVFVFVILCLPVIAFSIYFKDIENELNGLLTANQSGDIDFNSLENFGIYFFFAVFITFYNLLVFYSLPLIVINKFTPMRALKAAFAGLIKNVPAGLLNTLAYLFLTFLAIMPLMLGLIALIPVQMISLYCFYRDVFYQSENKIIF